MIGKLRSAMDGRLRAVLEDLRAASGARSLSVSVHCASHDFQITESRTDDSVPHGDEADAVEPASRHFETSIPDTSPLCQYHGGTGTPVAQTRGEATVNARLDVLGAPDWPDATWAFILDMFVRNVAALGCEAEFVAAQGERQRFYFDLLDQPLSNPEVDLTRICVAWRQLTGADICWIWLYDKWNSRFDLSAHDAAEGTPAVPNDHIEPGATSASMYVTQNKDVEVIDDVETWSRTLGPVTYTVAGRSYLARQNLRAGMVIPLLSETAPGVAETQGTLAPGAFIGTVTLVYKSFPASIGQPLTSLLLMGRFSARLVTESYLSNQRSILVSLTGLAQTYLARDGDPPNETRAKYLRALIALIRQRLHVSAVSVFYRLDDDDEICCIASTGLMDRADNIIPEADWQGVRYARGEGRTGRCFAQGEPIRFPPEVVDEESVARPKSYDLNPDTLKKAYPCVLFPICTAAGPDAEPGTPRTVLGVLRCGDHHAAVFPDRRAFDPIEDQTLGFIVEQAGVVLQTLDARIVRERHISVVKHDLATPLAMIANVIDSMRRDADNQKGVREIDLRDLQACADLAIGIAMRLDPDSGTIRAPRFERVYLEGDIVARVVEMLRSYADSQRSMSIRFDNVRSIPPLFVDRGMIERVLHNILINAVKYGTRGTQITVEGRESARRDGWYLDIASHGIGVTKAEEAQLFKKGYRSPRARLQTEGVGLGMYISQRLMEAHGGRVEVTAPNNPTVFSMFFPRDLANFRIEGDAK